ncbi:calcium-binding protein, partial [Endozoicomonas sp. YOMI1]|uniref:calcium-binding protein n=1 Tax=Endozoicomonas sp. YOMI1 TaxID=2828739 RepID=UPI00359FEEFE
LRIVDDADNVGATAEQDVIIPRPTVNQLTDHTGTPTLTGTAELSGSQLLTVTVNGKTYSYDPAINDPSPLTYDQSKGTWTLKIPEEDKLLENVYDVDAHIVTPDVGSLSDDTHNELIVDTTPVAPIMYATTRGTSLFSDFQHPLPPGKAYRIDVKADSLGYQTDNAGNVLEIGRETLYGGKNFTNHVLELKANHGDYNIFADIKSISGEVFQFTFDHAIRNDNGGSESAVEVWVHDLDSNGKVINKTWITTITPGDVFDLKTQTFYFVAAGKNTRLEILAADRDESDSTGAIIDNIRVETVGYQKTSSIPLNVVAATVNDNESLTVTVSDIPVGVTLTDGTHSFTATAGSTSIDISNWTLANMELQPAPDFVGNVSLTFKATAQDKGGDNSTESVLDLNYTIFPDVLPGNRQTDTQGVETLNGSANNDAINGLAGNDTIKGNAGDDILSGDEGNDRIEGGAGKDFIDGGEGNDLLIGGAGSDHFIFKIADLLDGETAQMDFIENFVLGDPQSENSNADILDLSGLVDFGVNETVNPATLQAKGISAKYQSGKAFIEFTADTLDGKGDKLTIVFDKTTGWSDLDGSGIDGNDVLQQLINNGQLIV